MTLWFMDVSCRHLDVFAPDKPQAHFSWNKMWIASIKIHMSVLSTQKLWLWLTQALFMAVGKGCVLLCDKQQLVQSLSYYPQL